MSRPWGGEKVGAEGVRRGALGCGSWHLSDVSSSCFLQEDSDVCRNIMRVDGCVVIPAGAVFLPVAFRNLLELQLVPCGRLAAGGRCAEGADKKQMSSCCS